MMDTFYPINQSNPEKTMQDSDIRLVEWFRRFWEP